ncbi:hypothetical protein F5X99DRAFT_423828 [Biscogniauxia marginata]|nr:hypothetical protein F5X99DRAFT_423828 [Biscogniauxia marginata]
MPIPLPPGISLTTPSSSSSSPSPRGRGVTATRHFSPGATIAVFEGESSSSGGGGSGNPVTIAIPDGAHLGETCHRCLSATAPVRACTGCRTAAYCSPACQRADWRSGAHKAECEVFRRVRDEGRGALPTPVRALVKALLMRPAGVPLAELEGHVDAFRRDRDAWGDMQLQALAALHYTGAEATPRSVADAIEILCKLQVNSFNRLDADIGQNGLFLNFALAMVNHSCVPNAFVQFIGRKAILHAYQEIKKDEEIEISYIECTPHRTHRQEALKRRYHFDCTCLRCEDDLDLYQVCQKYPHLELNSLSLFPDLQKLRNPPISRFLHSDKTLQRAVEDIYPTCSEPLRGQNSEGKVKQLRQRWKACEPLWKAELYAIDPMSQVLAETNIYFSENGHFIYSLAISCFIALNCDPYRSPMPFGPQRVKGLFMIAKLLSNTAPADMGSEPSKGSGPIATKISQILSKVDQATMCQVLLALVAHYGPAAHSTEWQVYRQATDLLSDIESLPGREPEDSLVKAFIRNPKGVEETRFFESAVLNPIRELSQFALEIMASEFSS